MSNPLIWDVFCRVIDNHGDLGVAVRLARQLHQANQQVRLWIDDGTALDWMAPDLISPDSSSQIQILDWESANTPSRLIELQDSQVWVELFGCELPLAFVQHGAARRAQTGQAQPVWLNLEYLSAEDYVARSHQLPSPIFSGPASGWKKWFFYPGFTSDTGGLLLSHAAQSPSPHAAPMPSPSPAATHAHKRPLKTTLFCYEPPALPHWLQRMGAAADALPIHWQVMPGRPIAAFDSAAHALGSLPGNMQVTRLKHMSQFDFDAQLTQADLNFVRGEDSLVSALRAGKPFIWHIYPQDDLAHHEKLRAFLKWLQAPDSLVNMHLSWNGVEGTPAPVLNAAHLKEWQACAHAAQARLASQTPLATQLLNFVRARHPS